MKLKKIPTHVAFLLMAAALLLSACGGNSNDSWAGLTLDSEQQFVYVANNDKVVALDGLSGATVWEYKRDTKFYAIPTIADGVLYVGDYEGHVHAVDLEDGSSLWEYEAEIDKLIGPISTEPKDRVISGVALDGDKVFFGLGGSDVVAVSRSSAEELWKFETDHGVWGTPLYIPAGDADGVPVLYVASLDHHFYAINADTGEMLWRIDLEGAAPGNMLYDPLRNRVYVGTFGSELLAIDLAEQTIAARFETEAWVWDGPALEVLENGTQMLYLGDLEGNLYAVRVTEGGGLVQEWKRPVTDEALRATPLLLDDMVIVGSQDNRVYALNKTDGGELWDTETKGEVLSEMVAASGDSESGEALDLIIVSTSDNDELVLALDAATGEKAWNYKD